MVCCCPAGTRQFHVFIYLVCVLHTAAHLPCETCLLLPATSDLRQCKFDMRGLHSRTLLMAVMAANRAHMLA